ncbi:MAG: hypothetical protein DMG61_01685 [Acidobacteria bacterium]|nr:MAG: hypothetical protein DMG61_01685 [Acidobacteriota bacterium]
MRTGIATTVGGARFRTTTPSSNASLTGGCGLVAELGSHHINFANEVFGAIPESAVGSGGVDFWKDGRETPDNVQVTYRYPGGKTLFFSAITTNRFVGCQVQVWDWWNYRAH